MKKNEYNYFRVFEEMTVCACACAEQLKTAFGTFTRERVEVCMKAAHEQEHRGDELKHEMLHRLAKEFLPPIEREDIVDFAQELDEVIDSVEDVLLRTYMFHITDLRPEALAFADLIERCCISLKDAASEFGNFKKSQTLRDKIIAINGLEEEGDRLYADAVRTLFTDGSEPLEVIRWTEMFSRFEECCDACEHAANLMETIIVKNT